MAEETLTTKEHTETHGDKIKGYRKLTEEEIDLVNKCKVKGEEIEALLSEIEVYKTQTGNHAIDPRWFAMARTDLQVGMMKLVRAICRPDSF